MGSFKPADFSDIEKELTTDVVEVPEKKSDFSKPNRKQLDELRQRLEVEMKMVEQGQSNITKRILQGTNLPSKNFMEALFNNFNEENLDKFILMLKEDYGWNMAKWATEIVSPWHPEVRRVLYNGNGET